MGIFCVASAVAVVIHFAWVVEHSAPVTHTSARTEDTEYGAVPSAPLIQRTNLEQTVGFWNMKVQPKAPSLCRVHEHVCPYTIQRMEAAHGGEGITNRGKNYRASCLEKCFHMRDF